MRFGLTILPELPWAELRPRWKAAEAMGFDHAWTYDHLVWGGLPESPWYGTMPTLTAAALVTERIGLGTFVSSPNFRHPLVLHRDVQSLDDVSEGRFLLGVGTGGDLDSRILGGPRLSTRERVDRFQEFVELLVRLRTEDHVDADGHWFRHAMRARFRRCATYPWWWRPMAPGRCASRLVLETPGSPRAEGGDRRGVVDRPDRGAPHIGGSPGADGRDPGSFPRYLNLDSSPLFSLTSRGVFEEMVGRAEALGFTDVITHWPRPDGPYAGSVAVLEDVAATVVGATSEQ